MRSQVTYFCESEFWDPKLTWYTETPQLTSCFQSTVLVYTPALTLVVSGLWDLHTCYHSKSRTLPWTGMQSSDWSILSILSSDWSGLLLAKLALTCMLLALAILELVSAIYTFTTVDTMILADILAPLVNILSYIISLVLLMTNKHFGQAKEI